MESVATKGPRLGCRHLVFWPPFLLLVAVQLISFFQAQGFKAVAEFVNAWILDNLATPFAWGALLIFATCCCVHFSPLRKITLGGKGAQRLLKPFEWFAVALCVNTAVGILFWAVAEPIYHVSQPPASLNLTPGSEGARLFALSTLYMHWSFIPCAIYALPGLMFALGYYNYGEKFSLAACWSSLGLSRSASLSAVLDAACVFCLVAGMAASLGTGILTLGGGLEHLGWAKSASPTWVAVGIAIVLTFVASSISGLDGGIKWFSLMNTYAFLLLLVVAIFSGPVAQMASWGASAVVEYGTQFFPRSLLTAFNTGDGWPKSWTVFYWAVWLAWAPVTGLFLGKIARGYTVGQFLLVNLWLPALFAIVWMTVFGVTTLGQEALSGEYTRLLAERGPESLAYVLLAKLPAAGFLIPFFLGTVFISYVTSADSNTTVIAGLCTTGVAPDSPEPKIGMRILWGGLIGIVSLLAVCSSGIDGIRTLSYMGGVPALLFELIACAALWKLLFQAFAAKGKAAVPVLSRPLGEAHP